MEDLERCILVKPEVFVYKIPPRQSARGYRAADWNLSTPDWTGRMRVMEKNKNVILKLEDRGSGDLFAACPIDTYPGPAIEAVTDSSRYFVIRIVNEASKQNAYIGLGFADRSDSFDLNVALQDHFKGVKKEDEILQEDVKSVPQLDLAFKAGQTIKVNINMNRDGEEKKTRPKPRSGMSGSLLPPPGSILPPPVPKVSAAAPPSAPTTPSNNGLDLLADFSDLSVGAPALASQPPLASLTPSASLDDPWGDFASAETGAKQSGNWVQF